MRNLLLICCAIFLNGAVFSQSSNFCGVVEYKHSTDLAYLYEEDYKMIFDKNFSYSEELVEGKRSTNLKNEKTERGVETKHIAGRDNLTSKFYYFNNKDLYFQDNYYDEILLVKEVAEQNIWKFIDERKELSGFLVHKATTKFRGRNYTAWYTPEIPLPYGPWKFNGLPGLILEVYDEEKVIYFAAEKISIAQDTVCELPIDKTILDDAMSIPEYLTAIERILDDQFAKLSAAQPKGARPLKRDKNCEDCKYGQVEIFED